MIFNRVWAMPNKNTFDIKPIKELIHKYHNDGMMSIDPFANKNRIAKITNDLDPDMECDYCLDALDFLKLFDKQSIDCVLYDPPYCYDDETEVFTKDGWKFIKDITNDDVIFTLNAKTNMIEYHNPLEIIRKRYSGTMYSFKSQSVDLLVTPNHRMWIKTDFYGNYEFIEAKDIIHKNIWFQKAADWDDSNKEVEYFILPSVELRKPNRYGERFKPEKKIKMDLWLRFLGYFISEGCAFVSKTRPTDYKISITQKKQPQRDEIREILLELGYKFCEEKMDFRIYDKQLYTYLKQFGKSYQKFIPSEIMNLSKRQLTILMEHLMKGDGTNIKYPKLNKSVNKIYHYTTNKYYTNSKKLVDCVSEISLKLGWGISIGINKKQNFKHVFGIHFLGAKHFKFNTKNLSKVEFDGYINCLTVLNSTLLVKRNGKICWCGNSPRQISECYKNLGRTVNMETTQSSFWGNLKHEISRIVKPDGIVMSFGWNSGGIGKTNGFEIIEILLVPHGGAHNDTICTIERKL